MAENDKGKGPAKAAEEDDAPEEFPVERLLAESSEMLGHPPHVLAGALEYRKIRKVNLTRAEAEKAIDAFLKHEVE